MKLLLIGLLGLFALSSFAFAQTNSDNTKKLINAYKFGEVYSTAEHIADWSSPENQNPNIRESYTQLLQNNENEIKAFCMQLGQLYGLLSSVRSEVFNSDLIDVKTEKMVSLLIPSFAYCGEAKTYEVKTPNIKAVLKAVAEIRDHAKDIIILNEVSLYLNH